MWFVGITIEAGRGDGISWRSADGLVLLNVTVKVRTSGDCYRHSLQSFTRLLQNVGRAGVDAVGSNNTFISGATINNTGCGGGCFAKLLLCMSVNSGCCTLTSFL